MAEGLITERYVQPFFLMSFLMKVTLEIGEIESQGKKIQNLCFY